MARIACPECEQTLNVPDGARAVRCPACKARIDLPLKPAPARVEEPDDEPELPRRPARRPRDDDEPLRRRAKTRARDKSSLRGIVAFVLFGPAILVLMAWAPFSGYGTALGMLVGALAMLVAIFGIVSRYFHDPVLTERVGDPNGRDAHLRMITDCIPAAFAHPRRIGLWVAVEALGTLVLVEAMCTAAFLKTMEDHPPGPGPNQPAQKGGPDAPAPPKPPSDDEVIAKALADLDSKQPGADWRALEDLAKAKPNQRRAEVLQKVVPLMYVDDGVTKTGAIKVVGAWGTPAEVPALLNVIAGRDPGPREEAIRQVTRFRDPRAIPVLFPWMNDYDAAQKALIEIGPAVEPHLIQFLDPQADFRKQGPALKILKGAGTELCVPHLRQLVQLNDGIRSRAAQEALDGITARARQEPPKP